ncbi:MAG TPA: hypothetical protein VFJ57_12930 [Solirubrobacterales bacterium]|nr:hypothetical protein [Solirubrobacterales bacterium]
MPNKALTLRLPEEKAAELAAVAQADKMHVSDAVREAIDNHIAARRADQDLRKRPREERGSRPSPNSGS